jgi:hypothetical protein
VAATPDDPATPDYPWYAVVRGNTLEQGDLLGNCPRFTLGEDAARTSSSVVQRDIVDAIILSQSCDLAIRADGQCEATDVLLCPVYTRSDLVSHPTFGRDAVWEEVRKGRRPFYHVLNACELPGFERDFVLLDFHAIFTLSVRLVREFKSTVSPDSRWPISKSCRYSKRIAVSMPSRDRIGASSLGIAPRVRDTT